MDLRPPSSPIGCCSDVRDDRSQSRVIVVRHGERIDEVQPEVWAKNCKAYLKANSLGGRNVYSYASDPPLTSAGIEQATKAANTLLSLIESSREQDVPVCIYSSKLQRTVMTAYRIALRLNVPIVLSTGLALTASAVRKSKGTFQFMDMESLGLLCPGISLIDGDQVDSPYYLPSESWLDPIHHLAKKTHLSVIVAHRETIMSLTENFSLPTPYCCIGDFGFIDSQNEEEEAGEEEESSMTSYIRSLYTKNGKMIQIPPAMVKKKRGRMHRAAQAAGDHNNILTFSQRKLFDDENASTIA
jgi:hypothetical protein